VFKCINKILNVDIVHSCMSLHKDRFWIQYCFNLYERLIVSFMKGNSLWVWVELTSYESTGKYETIELHGKHIVLIEKEEKWMKIDNGLCLWWKSVGRNENVGDIIHCRWQCSVSLLLLHTQCWFLFFAWHFSAEVIMKSKRKVWEQDNKRSEK